jgi:hypothetical protein
MRSILKEAVFEGIPTPQQEKRAASYFEAAP